MKFYFPSVSKNENNNLMSPRDTESFQFLRVQAVNFTSWVPRRGLSAVANMRPPLRTHRDAAEVSALMKK